jgi:hypothetical protein
MQTAHVKLVIYNLKRMAICETNTIIYVILIKIADGTVIQINFKHNVLHEVPHHDKKLTYSSIKRLSKSWTHPGKKWLSPRIRHLLTLNPA